MLRPTMHTAALLAADVMRPSGQLWRPLLIFGVIVVLMALLFLAQMTDPRRRSRGEADPEGDPPVRDPESTPAGRQLRTRRGRPPG